MNQFSRRTVLKGLGGIAVGLPFMEEMQGANKSSSIPVRSFNVFFGLGIPTPLQKEGYDGVFEALKPLKDKLMIMRGVDHVRADKKGINAHFDGASASFTAEAPDGEAKSGGPSIDQLIRDAHYSKGLPAGMVPALNAGTFFRRSRICRYVHSYNLDGTVSARMQERPRDVFDRVFGSLGGFGDPGTAKLRMKRSVLDSVIDQYKHFKGDNSPLSKASKARLADHLDRIREYEVRAFSRKDSKNPMLPPRSAVPHEGSADPGGQGIDITLEELTSEWRLMADIYALSIKMDRVRFGGITFLAAGERIRLTGDYYYNEEKRFEFNDRKHLKASGSKGCSHEYWHKFKENKKNTEMRAHIHMKLREVAYFLSSLDSKECLEANGKTILENSLFTVSTESGDGRHNDIKRELSGIFHAATGANGRFKTGGIIDVNAEGIDVYNTMLKSMGVSKRLGPDKRKMKEVGSILV